MMGSENGGQFSVPPGFRFHPTDEELLYYYLRKKVSYEAIDLDVIREVDLNKLEPWDLKDKCRIGSGPQNEWYFFSHKDKKYPTGTRTNRATAAGFWKATGRDKAIHLHSNSKRIGMRKTLVFYVGRAPHGQKTDWIMHEYRLDDQYSNATTPSEVQEDGWVVCRVFKKKNYTRSQFQGDDHQDHTLQTEDDHQQFVNQESTGGQSLQLQANMTSSTTTLFDSSMHLPQLLTSPPDHHTSYFPPPRHGGGSHFNHHNNDGSTMMIHDMGWSKNLLSLMSANGTGRGPCGCSSGLQKQDKPLLATGNMTSTADWSFLDKLLASNQHHNHGINTFDHHQEHQGGCDHHNDPSSSSQPFHHHPDVSHSSHVVPPYQYLGYETDIFKFSK